MGKIENMQENIGNISTQMEWLRNDKNEILEIKNTITEKKDAFDGSRGRPDIKSGCSREIKPIGYVT